MSSWAGALGGANPVFAFFLFFAPPFSQLPAFATVFHQSSTIGIPTVAVALLMIGGEVGPSAGVAVTSISLAFALSLGAINGWSLVRTKLPSFLVTLGTLLTLQGLNIPIPS